MQERTRKIDNNERLKNTLDTCKPKRMTQAKDGKYDFVVSPTVNMKRVICQSVMNN